ncbi:putative baseplate assembly protein [Haliangium sp.]|uniref:putative baseplate assembly protein n=1 Tax=Haliangium sp. TaxID=2663208 RepID=UPI003D0AD676
MSVWWGREQRGQPRLSSAGTPVPTEPDRRELARALRSRAQTYTPDWRGVGRADDAGEALVRLFAHQAEAVSRRIGRMPEKAYVEYLRAGGVSPRLGTPASVIVQFKTSPVAPRAVFVGRGFRLGARPASGDGELVEFETARDLYASPGKLARTLVEDGSLLGEVTADDVSGGSSFAPFGATLRSGNALWLGIDSAGHPGRQLSFAVGVTVSDASPPPYSAGGLSPRTSDQVATLVWEVLDGSRLEVVTAVLDETTSLTRSGLIEVSTPRDWARGVPRGDEGAPLYWLRLRVAYGDYRRPPRLDYVLINCTRASASATLRDRVLEPAPGGRDNELILPRAPVVPGSLVLQVDDPAAALTGDDIAGTWREVEDLSEHGPEDRVYTLDASQGVVRFGDGVHGAALPVGFRHVRALSFRVESGAESAVAADTVTTLLGSAPLLLAANNPLPATGGKAAEPRARTLLRGPEELRARGRAVAGADYALLATAAPGAIVERAHAVAGYHPEVPGLPQPGVVGVLVVGAVARSGPPVPDQDTLRAVAVHLSAHAPAGVEVVAAAPRFHDVSVEIGFVAATGADPTTTSVALLDAVDAFLHPLTGGGDGLGWPFGGVIGHAALMRRLLAVSGVEAVPRLVITLDQRRMPACEDVALSPYGLIWTGSHEVVPVDSEGGTA